MSGKECYRDRGTAGMKGEMTPQRNGRKTGGEKKKRRRKSMGKRRKGDEGEGKRRRGTEERRIGISVKNLQPSVNRNESCALSNNGREPIHLRAARLP